MSQNTLASRTNPPNSAVRIITENGQPVEIRDDGSRVTGYVWGDNGLPRCPTEICDAYCCKTGTLFPDMPPPCEYLTKARTCYFHDRGGLAAKPLGCTEYPRNQADIDHMNRNAPEGGGCVLRVSHD